jgi:amidase
LTQIERVNPKVNAIVTLVPELAAAAAARADEMQARGEMLGPLHGLPVEPRLERDVVEVAPVPVLARFVRSDDRMPGQAEVRCRVPPRRVVTASYVTAFLADP